MYARILLDRDRGTDVFPAAVIAGCPVGWFILDHAPQRGIVKGDFELSAFPQFRQGHQQPGVNPATSTLSVSECARQFDIM